MMTKFTGAVAWAGKQEAAYWVLVELAGKPPAGTYPTFTGETAEAPAEFSGKPPTVILLNLAEGWVPLSVLHLAGCCLS